MSFLGISFRPLQRLELKLQQCCSVCDRSLADIDSVLQVGMLFGLGQLDSICPVCGRPGFEWSPDSHSDNFIKVMRHASSHKFILLVLKNKKFDRFVVFPNVKALDNYLKDSPCVSGEREYVRVRGKWLQISEVLGELLDNLIITEIVKLISKEKKIADSSVFFVAGIHDV